MEKVTVIQNSYPSFKNNSFVEIIVCLDDIYELNWIMEGVLNIHCDHAGTAV